MNIVIVVIMIIVDIALLLEILYFILRKSVINRLIRAAFENDDEHFNALCNSLFGKIVSEFDKKMILYNVAEIRKDSDKMEILIREFEEMDLSDRQKKQIYPKIFYYYVDKGRNDKAKEYYQKLSVYGVYSNKKDIEMTYDAYIKGGSGYLDEALKQLNRTPRQDLPAKERLIAKMYENKGINADAKKYRSLADRHEAELKKKPN